MSLQNEELGKIACDLLNLFQSDHGANAAVGDYTRAQIIEALEKGTGLI
jgi:hypothetical protein